MRKDKTLILNRIKEAKGFDTDVSLAGFLGISSTTLSNWRSRNTIDYDLIFTKCDDISKEWLITGNGPMLYASGHGIISDMKSQYSAPSTPVSKDYREEATAPHSADGIPLIPLDAVAGFCNGNSDHVMEYGYERYIVPNFSGAEFLIQVNGSSMYPIYSSGDMVACKCLSLDTFFQWNKVYVADTEQGILIKRVKPGQDAEHVMMVSENERYPPFEIHRKNITSLAIVIGVIRPE